MHSVTFYGNESVGTASTSSTVRMTLSSGETTTTHMMAVTSPTVPSPNLLSTSTTLYALLSSSTQDAGLSSSTVAVVGGCYDFDQESSRVLNTDVRGTVEYDGNVYVDYCVGDVLYEYYCDDGEMKVLEITCGPGCSGGRCGLSSTTTA